jgi:glycosyltransferase involved in cell wall biosynthesis
MPVFNGEAFIGRAIESLLVQSFREWELVVIDDGSWDRTAAVVAEFDEGRIQYARLSANEGLGVALNAGLKQPRAR